jgi:hypothetical protein
VPYLRLTADRRGVENTFLLHVAAPGERPKILYWYRTVPGVKVGRPALDDAAMRSLEEQYPDIDFDWPYILDVGAMTPVEVEAAIPPRKRKPPPRRPESEIDGDAGADVAPTRVAAAVSATVPVEGAEPPAPVVAADFDDGPDLLSELLGRGIAASLREQYATLAGSIDAAVAGPAAKAAWRERLARLDPDSWESPEAVLAGMGTVQRDFDVLTDELDRATPGA